ncbi:diguanylate cyclase (GGDEF) domain-containing protein [Halopseudomonas salegens]|uniref:Diguanylate cyclase (GGDEF) domain-containing protein n=2 Tax=Halopseudomonas salegens TaxID=1434072 RepID=A0A1H2DYE8_9GAMM|nr:diguanylate cyclase (GGDEF) domain-containing protein [Halopseudomonas salegens]
MCWLIPGLLLLASPQLLAHNHELSLSGSESQLDLQPWLDFALLPAEYGLDDVHRSEVTWQAASNRSDLNFSYSEDAVWLRLSLKSTTSRDQIWFVHFPYSSLNRIELHGLGPQPELSGDSVPLSDRQFAHRDPSFVISLAAGEQKTLYFKATSGGSLTLTSQIWSPQAFAGYSVSSMAVITLYLGMLLAMAIYNLLLFSVLREKTYLCYVAFVVVFGVGALSFTGIGSRFIWPELGAYGSRILPLSLCLSGLLGTLFIRSFLQIKQHLPQWYTPLGVIVWLCLAFSLLSLVAPIRVSIQGMSVLAIITAPLVLACIVQAARVRVPGARIVLLAWSLMIAGMVLLALRNFGLLPSNFVTTYAMHVGSALEMLLLSFALAARFNTLKEQREKAQQSALNAQSELVTTLQEHERQLEEKVAERTAELAAVNARLERMAMQDPLTNLANRAALEQHIGEAMRRSQRRSEYLAVMLVDLDGFKQINDQLGHETGDAVLRCIAERMQETARESDFVARLGGDEFVLVAESILDRHQAAALAERFLDELSLPIELAGQSIAVGASIGITLTRSADPDMPSLLRQADNAMYKRKRSGRHGVSFHEPAGGY